mgnify:CR=1 FL=1
MNLESFPWLSSIVLLPLIGALIMPFLSSKEGEDNTLPRNISLSFLFIDFLLIISVFLQKFDTSNSALQLVERATWLPSIGLEWSLGVDGLSAPLVALSGLITFLSAAASWKIKKKSNLYFALLLVQASAQALVFLSQDFLLFFLAWELELVPVYLLIAIWGGKKKLYAATKFILYTALASLLILISGLAIALSGDTFTLNITDLTNKHVTGSLALLSYLGFLIGFGVKLPIFPLHTWLPDAHGEANAPVSMLLAGVLLKMGGYALIRFNVQILPDTHLILAPALIIIGIVNHIGCGSECESIPSSLWVCHKKPCIAMLESLYCYLTLFIGCVPVVADHATRSIDLLQFFDNFLYIISKSRPYDYLARHFIYCVEQSLNPVAFYLNQFSIICFQMTGHNLLEP